MDRKTANQILDSLNRAERSANDVEAGRRELEDAGYPTKRSAHTGAIVPLIKYRGLKWGEPDNA